MVLRAEWREADDSESILIVDDFDNSVLRSLAANPMVLNTLLTNMGDLSTWRGESVGDDKRNPSALGELIIARANSGEVLSVDPERFWGGIYSWFRSQGVDYDSLSGIGDARFANSLGDVPDAAERSKTIEDLRNAFRP